MPDIFVVTCGTSLFTNNRVEPSVQMIRNLHSLVGEPVELQTAWKEAIADDEVRLMLEQGGRPRECAEISALRARPRALQDDGKVVLLSSDSDEGVVAALAVGAMLAERVMLARDPQSFHNICQGEDGEELSGVGRAAAANVVRITGLKPETDMLQQAAKGFARVFASLALVEPDPTFVLNITGGYKTCGPILVGVAEHLPARFQRECWALHESRTECARIPMRVEGLDGIASDLAAVGGAEFVPDRRWQGWAFRRSENKWELTELGQGLAALQTWITPVDDLEGKV